MKIDPLDPANHGKPLWVVYGDECFPSIICAKLLAYTDRHELLPVGTRGSVVCIWGYSVYRRQPGFRTMGVNVIEWSGLSSIDAEFYATHEAAIARIRELTTPSPMAV